ISRWHCRLRGSEHEFNPSRQASFTGTCPHWVRSGFSSQYQFYVSSIADNLAVLRLLVGDSRSGKKGAWNAARRLEFHKSRNLILTRGGLPGVRAKHTIVGSKHLPK